ncbi:hypothetical protein D770_20315 [Flammeovirgaceae bacterium 311]|nr:hypothetical protein D770_20315 [Flammeovirgaceae bacterium 311]
MSAQVNRIDENTYTAFVQKDEVFAVEFVSGEPPKFSPEQALEKPKGVTRGTDKEGAIKFAAWGSDNRLPNHLVTLLLNNNLAPGVMDTKDQLLIGDDYVFYYEKYENNKKIKVPFDDPELDDWLEEAGFEQYMREAVIDYNWLANVFAKLSYGNKAGGQADKITKVTRLQALDCRASMMNEQSRRVEWYGVADWMGKQNQQVQVLPAYNPDPKKTKQPQEFVMHVKKDIPGNPYYALPPYIGAQYWIRHANKIPVWKTANMDNSANIKYHIQVPEKYFQDMYPSPDYTREEREAKRKEMIATIASVLSGADNAGKTFYSSFAVDDQGRERPGWKIEAIKNDIQHEAYSKDFQDANSAILSSLGVDPALSGVLLPGAMGAGSGSKERMAFEVAIKKTRYGRNILLEPWHQAMKINKTHKRQVDGLLRRVWIGIQDTIFQTLDANPTGKQDAI